ncbi:MAG TPA: NAD(P)H-quinone oxidoreductase [Gemmatimonadaceae bacterium]|nr:NAD(P)H-quinone oxidoreductase [Gemmatimonadaceae bacterium]
MKAVVIARHGGPEVLEVRDVPRPDPEHGHILVRVRASALNRADVLQRQGRYPAPPGDAQEIPGIEFAGEVAELGRGARDWRVGDRVFGIIGGGAHAEYVTIHERAVARVPDELEWDGAGAVPEAFITAHDALITQAQARPSERVLIHAVGSGVGLAAVQLARAAGAIPYGTSRTPDKIDRTVELGLANGAVLADDVAQLVDHVDRWTDGRGMDIVLDLVGGPYVEASIAALGARGRLMLIGTIAGGRAELPIGVVMSKRLTIVGTVLRARPLEEKIVATRAFAQQVVPLLARGVVRPIIDSVFSLAAIAEAHRRMESNETYGKIVIRLM